MIRIIYVKYDQFKLYIVDDINIIIMNLYFFITCTNLFSPYITFHSAERNKLNTVLHMLSTLFFHHDGEMQLQLVRSFLLQCLKKSERSQPVVSYLFLSSSPFPDQFLERPPSLAAHHLIFTFYLYYMKLCLIHQRRM